MSLKAGSTSALRAYKPSQKEIAGRSCSPIGIPHTRAAPAQEVCFQFGYIVVLATTVGKTTHCK